MNSSQQVSVLSRFSDHSGRRGIQVDTEQGFFAFYPVGLSHQARSQSAHDCITQGAVDVLLHLNQVHPTDVSRAMVASHLDTHKFPFGAVGIKLFRFHLRHEPENEHDPNAIRIIATMPTNILRAYTFDHEDSAKQTIDFGWVPKQINKTLLDHMHDFALDHIAIYKIKKCWDKKWTCKLAIPLKQVVVSRDLTETSLWLGWVDE
jgi:hypothetical protein